MGGSVAMAVGGVVVSLRWGEWEMFRARVTHCTLLMLGEIQSEHTVVKAAQTSRTCSVDACSSPTQLTATAPRTWVRVKMNDQAALALVNALMRAITCMLGLKGPVFPSRVPGAQPPQWRMLSDAAASISGPRHGGVDVTNRGWPAKGGETGWARRAQVRRAAGGRPGRAQVPCHFLRTEGTAPVRTNAWPNPRRPGSRGDSSTGPATVARSTGGGARL